MAIGSSQSVIVEKKIPRLFIKMFGVSDLHTHIRINPLLKFFRKNILPNNFKILEIGCGSGINLLEIFKIKPGLSGEGYDLNAKEIEKASKIVERMSISNLSFFHADATKLSLEKKYDVILLIDFIEHIQDPQDLIRKVDEHLKNGGFLLISVPTPLYPKVFGREFHNEIGHLVDGFTYEDLLKIIPSNYEVVNKKYTTGLFSCLGCFLYYRIKLQIKYLSNFIKYFLLTFRYLDLINNKYLSSSLFVAFKKQ